MRTGEPCPCWSSPPWLHEGHCCFMDGWNDGDAVTCGHDEAGIALVRASQPAPREETKP